MQNHSLAPISRRNLLVAPLSLLLPTSAPATSLKSSLGSGALPQASADKFIDSIGVCTHFSQVETPYVHSFDATLQNLLDLGIRHVRDEAVITTSSNRNSDLFKRIRQCAQHGLRFSMICFDPLSPYNFTPPSMLEAIFDWCDGAVEIFEGSNEPVLQKKPWRDPLICAEHQRQLYRTCKSSVKISGISVAGPSLIQHNIKLAENLSSACDLSNIHAYAGKEHPEYDGLDPGSLAAFVADSKQVFGDRPILVTEIGYHTALQTSSPHLPVSEEIRARYVPRMLLWAFLHDIRRSYIYELVSSFAPDPKNPESAFGLLDNNLGRTPSFNAVKALISLCQRTSAKSKPIIPEKIMLLVDENEDVASVVLERGDGSVIIPIWLGLDGWEWRERAARGPVERKATLAIDDEAIQVVSHRFKDDGTQETRSIQREQDVYRFPISDQLTVIEVFK